MPKDRNEVELVFSDPTILESEGKFKEVKKIMEKEMWKGHKWMLASNLTVNSVMGLSEMVVHFYHDKNIIIKEYTSFKGDVFYNPNIQALSVWARQNGWNPPQPYIDLIRTDLDFWKHFWETFLVDSEYFDERFGKRETNYNEEEKKEEEEK